MINQKNHVRKTISRLSLKDAEETNEILNNLESESNCTSFYVYPNFVSSWLSTPQGFISVFKEQRVYNPDIFRCEKYRVFTLQDLDMTTEQFNNLMSNKNIEQLFRRCFPVSPNSAPTLNDDLSSGWSPSLSKRSSSLGLYSYTIKSSTTVKTHYCIICDSGLPDSLLHSLHERDYEKGIQNFKIKNEKVTNAPTYYKYRDEFINTDLNQKMLEISKENNKRLIEIAAELLGFPLLLEEKISPFFVGQDKKNYYRCDKKYIDKYEKCSNSEKIDKLIQCLNWWPTAYPIYLFSVIPEVNFNSFSEEIAPNIKNNDYGIPEQIKGFPIGYALFQIKDLAQFKELEKKHSIVFCDVPMTFNPTLEVDYNTFRIDENSNNLYWYSETTPINDTKNGILMKHPLEVGFEWFNSSRIPNYKPDFAWANDYGNGFPVRFPYFDQQESIKKDFTKELSEKFFSPFYGGKGNHELSLAPKQLRINQQTLSDAHKKELYKSSSIQSIDIIPCKVFLSEEIMAQPHFEIN